MKPIILVFGSDNMESDDLAVRVSKKLEKKIKSIKFVRCKSPDDILNYLHTSRVFIMDVMKGIGDVTLLL